MTPVSIVFQPTVGMINKIQIVRLVVVIRQKRLAGSQLSQGEHSRTARATSADFRREIDTRVVAQTPAAN